MYQIKLLFLLLIVTYITKCTKDINPALENGWTVMHLAAARGQKSIIEFYVSKLEDINPRDKFTKRTPLHEAAKNGHLDIVELITSVVYEKYPKDAYGFTPLHLASQNGHTSIVEYFGELEFQAHLEEEMKHLAKCKNRK